MGSYLSYNKDNVNLTVRTKIVKPMKFLSIDQYADVYDIFVKMDKSQRDGRLTKNCIFYPPMKFNNYFRIKFHNQDEITITSSRNPYVYAELSSTQTHSILHIFNFDDLISEINHQSLNL